MHASIAKQWIKLFILTEIVFIMRIGQFKIDVQIENIDEWTDRNDSFIHQK